MGQKEAAGSLHKHLEVGVDSKDEESWCSFSDPGWSSCVSPRLKAKFGILVQSTQEGEKLHGDLHICRSGETPPCHMPHVQFSLSET